MGIPLLDASNFRSGSPSLRKKYVQDLCASLSAHGAVRLSNHGIQDDAVKDFFELSKRFFALPTKVKATIANPPGPNPQRGWSSIGMEKTSSLYGKMMGQLVSPDLKDAREHFDQGRKDDPLFPNRWPAEDQISGFRSSMETYFLLCERASLEILEGLEEALNLPVGTFRNRCKENASEMRLNYYPPITLEEMRAGNVNRIWPHFDLGIITLLFADTVGGLEFENRQEPSTFIPVETELQTEMIVNVSETLQRWTNDRLPAGLHQVTIPQHMKGLQDGEIQERYSVAYLCKADRDISVGPLPYFVKDSEITHYEEMTALEYHRKRLLTAY